MAVFKYQVFTRSVLIIFTLSFLIEFLGQALIFLQILIVFFNLIIFLVSLREKKSELLNSQENLKNVDIITH